VINIAKILFFFKKIEFSTTFEKIKCNSLNFSFYLICL
jgi:hypothetical protein